MLRFIITTVLGALLACTPALAEDSYIQPPSSMRAEGIPPIPASLARKIEAYTDFRPKSFVAWHPVKREVLIAMRATNTTQIHRVAEPLIRPVQLTEFADPVRSARYEPKSGDFLVFGKDTGGSEATQLYRLDPAPAGTTLLTDPNMLHRAGAWNHAGDRMAMSSTHLDKTGKREKVTTEIALLDPRGAGTIQQIASLAGTWTGLRFSPNDKKLLLIHFRSNAASELWELALATGEKSRLLPSPPVAEAFYGNAEYLPDGSGIVLTSDQDGEFHQLLHYSFATHETRVLTRDIPWNVDHISISRRTGAAAIVINEGGRGVLRLYDIAAGTELKGSALLALPDGVISNAEWHDNGVDLAFNLRSAQNVGDVYSVNVKTGALTRWTETTVAGIDMTRFREPESITWNSFDKLKITGFLYRPPATHAGKRPVLISIHGGPESQARPNFLGRSNYFVNDLGIAMIFPNVRGSSGFGKTFLSLDNGVKREDSVQDIGALLDWIATQPDLDADRVMVMGGSYGGYMALAVSARYADRIAGSIDIVGISNFVSFLERTESYRRDLRRAEYGDERDPAMRAFLERISPLTSAHKIAKPLLVVQGKNDPRVPWQESEQIVAKARLSKIPVWYLLADNEGHGFAKKDNADFQFYAMIRFAEEILLK